jgi:hypothetical protein
VSCWRSHGSGLNFQCVSATSWSNLPWWHSTGSPDFQTSARARLASASVQLFSVGWPKAQYFGRFSPGRHMDTPTGLGGYSSGR